MDEVNGPAGYSLYDLFRVLIERVGWPSEAEKKVALASVDRAEKMQVFGNLASMMACEHPEEAMTKSGKCADCGRQVENTVFQNTHAAGRPRYVREWESR